MYKFGSVSKDRLETTHKDLQTIFNEAIKYTPIDFGISEGFREPERQFELFKLGRRYNDITGKWEVVDRRKVVTNVDGYIKKSNHNYQPSMAVDVYAYVPNTKGQAWTQVNLALIIGVLLSTANRLYEEGKITHKLRSGANWDNDGEFLTDQSFNDMPHVELYK